MTALSRGPCAGHRNQGLPPAGAEIYASRGARGSCTTRPPHAAARTAAPGAATVRRRDRPALSPSALDNERWHQFAKGGFNTMISSPSRLSNT